MNITAPARSRSIAGSINFSMVSRRRSVFRSAFLAIPTRTTARLFALSPTEIISTTSSPKSPLCSKGLASDSPPPTASAAASIASTKSGLPAASRLILIDASNGIPLANNVPSILVNRATAMVRVNSPTIGTLSCQIATRRRTPGRSRTTIQPTTAPTIMTSINGHHPVIKSDMPSSNRVATGSSMSSKKS